MLSFYHIVASISQGTTFPFKSWEQPLNYTSCFHTNPGVSSPHLETCAWPWRPPAYVSAAFVFQNWIRDHLPAATCEAWPLPPLQSPLWNSGPLLPASVMIWKSCAPPHQQCPFFPPCAMKNIFPTPASTSGGAPWSCSLNRLPRLPPHPISIILGTQHRPLCLGWLLLVCIL